MRNLLILFALLTITSCGSKKKITNVSKSYDLVIDKSKKTVEERSDTKRTDTSKTKTKVTERLNEQTIERYIFSDEGRLQEYSKETNKKGEKQTDTDEKKGISIDSVGQRNESSVSDIKKESKDKDKDAYVDKKAPWPVWWFIGAGIVIVVIFFGLKLFLKR